MHSQQAVEAEGVEGQDGLVERGGVDLAGLRGELPAGHYPLGQTVGVDL